MGFHNALIDLAKSPDFSPADTYGMTILINQVMQPNSAVLGGESDKIANLGTALEQLQTTILGFESGELIQPHQRNELMRASRTVVDVLGEGMRATDASFANELLDEDMLEKYHDDFVTEPEIRDTFLVPPPTDGSTVEWNQFWKDGTTPMSRKIQSVVEAHGEEFLESGRALDARVNAAGKQFNQSLIDGDRGDGNCSCFKDLRPYVV